MLILDTWMTAMKLVWETIGNNYGTLTLWKLFKGQESNFQLYMYHANGENKLHFGIKWKCEVEILSASQPRKSRFYTCMYTTSRSWQFHISADYTSTKIMTFGYYIRNLIVLRFSCDLHKFCKMTGMLVFGQTSISLSTLLVISFYFSYINGSNISKSLFCNM